MTMLNRIHITRVDIRRLSVAEAEVCLTVEVERLTPETELRGKITGPRCPGVSTVEVAYALRPLSGSTAASDKALRAQVVIPEPNLWTEKTPFIYEARLELWQDGEPADRANLQVGLKQAT
jgi:beta-galactosidase/beta-glucuronidase